MSKEPIKIFTDGASRGNPGPGGWGAVILLPDENKVVELGGHEDHTTNNRMEIQAAINALLHIRHLSDNVIIHTDSSYLIQGITTWVKGWVKNGWTTQGRDEVQNRDLWEILAAVVEEREEKGSEAEWKHVSGHAGVGGNERADIIATQFADLPAGALAKEGGEIVLYIGPASDYKINLTSTEENKVKKIAKDSKRARSSKPAYSYVSVVDGNVETHKTWAECEARVKGTKGAKYQKVFSADEEKELIKEWQK
jgi:ribonuclease HI